MKFSKSLINFDEESNTPDEVTKETVNTNEPNNELTEEDKAAYQQKVKNYEYKKQKHDAKYDKVCKNRETVGSNGIKHGYVDLGYEVKSLVPHKDKESGEWVKGEIINTLGKAKDAVVRDAKDVYHGVVKGEIADKRDENGNPISYKQKPLTLFKTEEDTANEAIAKAEGKKIPNNNAILGTTGFKAAEVATPFVIGGAFLANKLFKRNRRKKLYKELLEEGYSPAEAKKLSDQVNESEQQPKSKQTNFNALVNGAKWLLEYGLVAPFKGRKITSAFNPTTGKVQQFKEGIKATKNVYNDKGVLIAKPGEYIREGGMAGASTLPEKVGKGALGAANVGLTASLLTMPASVAADFKRNAEYTKKYTIDPNKHYVIEQDLADNKKVRLIGKTSGYLDRSDANIEAERHAGNGMYQVYAIKGSELARIMPRKFTLEYYEDEY